MISMSLHNPLGSRISVAAFAPLIFGFISLKFVEIPISEIFFQKLKRGDFDLIKRPSDFYLCFDNYSSLLFAYKVRNIKMKLFIFLVISSGFGELTWKYEETLLLGCTVIV
ncbi:unnamed protein product [Oikopleura dioica]|uniref:Uncharacterized protein n=1 Tax=Oikopleura dioica TaxID=34765 RepID=E4Y3L1_OIKDI|nr:unnamed protein product [Oikopleura dioica]